MKINAKTQLGLSLNSDVAEQIIHQIYETQIKLNADAEHRLSSLAHLAELFREELEAYKDSKNALVLAMRSELLRDREMGYEMYPMRHYIMANTAMDLVKRVKINPHKFDVKFLTNVKNKKITFLLGSDLAIRVSKVNKIIYCSIILRITAPDSEAGFRVKFDLCSINTESGKINFPSNMEKPFEHPDFILLLQLIIFTELSVLETVVIKPNGKHGAKKEGKLFNESKHNITIVDSTWNRLIVRTEGFGVSGHFRLQPCGKGLINRELIWIDAFTKNGYIRRPKGNPLNEPLQQENHEA